jgi:preprotein translocase subunit YajC
MLISPAYAQSGGGGGFDVMQMLPLVLIFVVFYFLLIRPQQKKAKVHREMVAALRRGDKVVTAGGLVGTVAKVLNEQEVLVEIADGVRVRVVRSQISETISKTAPVSSAKDAGGKGGPTAANDGAKKSGSLLDRLRGN